MKNGLTKNMGSFYMIKARMKYLLKAHYRKGHQIHSPYLFRFMNFVLFEDKPYYFYDDAEKLWRGVLARNFCSNKDKELLDKIYTALKRKCDRKKDIELLHRICVHERAEAVVIVGENIAMEAIYMSRAATGRAYAFENNETAFFVDEWLRDKVRAANILMHTGDVICGLRNAAGHLGEPFDVANISFETDADKIWEAYEICKRNKTNDAVFVIDGIHRSKDTETIWTKILNDEEKTASVDIFHKGIVWFNPHLPKKNYIVKY
jgi:hypothetical protein